MVRTGTLFTKILHCMAQLAPHPHPIQLGLKIMQHLLDHVENRFVLVQPDIVVGDGHSLITKKFFLFKILRARK